jgi:DNA-directed RNA polymerase specialized sigma subunit
VAVSIEKHGQLTLKEAAKRLGVSHVRIKQIQDKALKKIKKFI